MGTLLGSLGVVDEFLASKLAKSEAFLAGVERTAECAAPHLPRAQSGNLLLGGCGLGRLTRLTRLLSPAATKAFAEAADAAALPLKWYCDMNPDPLRNTCAAAEETETEEADGGAQASDAGARPAEVPAPVGDVTEEELRKSTTNASGYVGVARVSNNSGRWQAMFRCEYLGTFSTPREAAVAVGALAASALAGLP